MNVVNNAARILRLKDVCERTGLSRSTIYLKITENTFPKPIKLGRRSVGWTEESVAQWIQSRIDESRTVLHLSAN